MWHCRSLSADEDDNVSDMPLEELVNRMFARVTFLPTLAYNLAMERLSSRY